MPRVHRRKGLLMIAVILVPLVLGAAASADSATLTSLQLPSERRDTSAVWDGRSIIVFGGCPADCGSGSGALDEIVKVDVATGQATVANARLTAGGLTGTSAVWDGRDRPDAGCPGGCAYVFGGIQPGNRNYKDTILRYNPTTDTIATMSAKLPTPRSYTGAVWNGTHAFLLGGCCGSLDGAHDRNFRDVLVYDPVADVARLSAAQVPSVSPGAYDFPSGFWDGRYLYIYGGSTRLEAVPFGIYRFDPQTDTAVDLQVAVPNAWNSVSAGWDGRAGYFFGGCHAPDSTHDCESNTTAQVLRYVPGARAMTVSDASLPAPRAGTSAVWTGQAFYVVGGVRGNLDGVHVAYRDIVRFTTDQSVLDAVAELSDGVRDGFARVLAAMDGLSARVTEGFARMLASIDALGRDIAARFAETLTAIGRVQATLDDAQATEPLQVSLTSSPGPAAWRGPFYATVLLRGELAASELSAYLDGRPAGDAVRVTALDAAGLYQVTVAPGTPLLAPHALTIRAVREGHEGAATVWLGADLGVGIPDPTQAPGPGQPVEVRVLTLAEEVPSTGAALPGADVPLAAVRGSPGGPGRDYTITWDVGGRATGSVALPGVGALPPLALALVSVPGTTFAAPGASVALEVSYVSYAGARPCIVPTQDGCVAAPAPVSADWLRGPGMDASLRIALRLLDGEGRVIAERSADVPLAGQAVGWAAATARTPG